jgi:transposase
MMKNGEHFMIKEMQQKGMKITQIASELGRDRKTIRKWLQEEETKTYRRTQTQKCLLDPFKTYVKERMEEGCLNAVVIYDEIKTKGYAARQQHPSSTYVNWSFLLGVKSNDRVH